jgi:hypothetical protein
MDLLSYVNSIQITHRNNTETQDITLTLLSPVGFVTFPIKALTYGVTRQPLLIMLEEIEVVTKVIPTTPY